MKRRDQTAPHQLCGDDCRYRKLYEGSQRSLSDMAGRQAQAVARVGRLRSQMVLAVKRAFPRAFADAERSMGVRMSDTGDEVLVAYLESFLDGSAGSDTGGSLEVVRAALVEIGIPVPDGYDLSDWAAAIRRHGIDRNDPFATPIAVPPQVTHVTGVANRTLTAAAPNIQAGAPTSIEPAAETRTVDIDPESPSTESVADPAAHAAVDDATAMSAIAPVDGEQGQGGGLGGARSDVATADGLDDLFGDEDDLFGGDGDASAVDDMFGDDDLFGTELDSSIGDAAFKDINVDDSPFDDHVAPLDNPTDDGDQESTMVDGATSGPAGGENAVDDLDALFGSSAGETIDDNTADSASVDDTDTSSATVDEGANRQQPEPAIEPLPAWATGKAVKPQLFPTVKPTSKREKRASRVRAMPADVPDVPVTEAPTPTGDVLTDEVRARLLALASIPRPVFTADLVAALGSEDLVQLWRQEWQDGDLTVRFVLPKPRHRSRGPLVVPQSALQDADTSFATSWWGRCMERYRGARLYELGVFFHRFAEQVISFDDERGVISVRMSLPQGLTGAILVADTQLGEGGATRDGLCDAIERFLGDRLVHIAVLVMNAEQFEPVAEAVEAAARERRWRAAMPVTLSRSWEYTDGVGTAVPLLGV